ncbi:MAG TPA: cytochrome P450 [Xanthobacteraceae bacterium]|nr:cytochrome P450 [Xanthobacteraceae bacterium]
MAMAETAADAPLLDLSDPRFLADPYPFYRLLRERAPVWRSPTGLWVLSRHADVAAVLKDSRFGHDFEGKLSDPRSRSELLDEPVFRGLGLSMLVRDPPDHTRLRGLVAKAFTARRLEAMRPKIAALVETLLDTVEPRGAMDVIGDFARPLPVLVICDLLGIPEEDRPRFLGGYRVSGRALDPTPMTRAELDEVNAIAVRNRGYFEDLFERRRDADGDDLISALLHVRDEHDGRLSHDELAANIGLLFGAGHETTTHLIGNGLLALHRHPDQWQKLVAEPALAGNAVEELLRFDSSVQLSSRKAFEDVTLDGTIVRRGESVMCLLGAANRDPEVYADPDRLDITRTGVRPLSFGGGIHHCLGAQLARIEGEIAFRRLAQRLPKLALEDVEHPTWRPTITLRGLTQLPARWDQQVA